MSDRRKIHLSTFALGVVTLLSRVSGLAREIVVAGVFGAGAVMSAFTVAYQIPNVIRLSVTDIALTTALIPSFTKLLEQGEEARAWRMAVTVAGLILAVTVPLTILGGLFATDIIQLAMPAHFAGIGLAASLFQIMIPMLAMMSLAGLMTGILNAYGLFTPSAMAPIAWNATVICFVAVGARSLNDEHRAHAYAFGVLAGTVVQVLVPLPWLRRRIGAFNLGLALQDPSVKVVVRSMLPVIASLLLLDLNLLVDSYFSARISPTLVAADTGPALLDKAYRIFQVPQGMFSVAVTAVFFPLFSRLHAHGDVAGLRLACLDGLRYLLVLLLPASALLIVLAGPIVTLLYQHGAWDPSQTPLVIGALRAFAAGLVANGAILLLMRAFFSMHMPWTAAIAGLVAALSNVVLAGLLYERFGTSGIAAATSMSNVIGFLVVYGLLHHRLDGFPHRQFLRILARSLAATGGATLLVLVVVQLVERQVTAGFVGMAALIAIAAGLGYAAYLALAIRLNLLSWAALGSLWRRS